MTFLLYFIAVVQIAPLFNMAESKIIKKTERLSMHFEEQEKK
jgi:hypothetical protein